MPMSSMMPPPAMIMLNAKRTHGRYMALNWVPNQNCTITSLLSWHQTYSIERTKGSMRKGMLMNKATMTLHSQQKSNINA